jgi:hypothetical protein
MAWAMGAGFPATFKAFTAAINAGDYETAKLNADFKGTGVANRIAANKAMLDNAAESALRGIDPSALFWPSTVDARELPTTPAIPLPFHSASTIPPPRGSEDT